MWICARAAQPCIQKPQCGEKRGCQAAEKDPSNAGGNDYFTDGHIDGYARFVAPGRVACEVTEDRSEPDYALAREKYDVLKNMTDARGRKLQVLNLESPRKTRLHSPYFAANYLNFYLVNGGVMFPNRKVVQLNIDHIASGGGGIHCVTLEQPL